MATGTATPNPPIVGSNIGLNLDVIFNDEVHIEGNYIYVAFTAQGSSSPIPLYAQDFPATNPGDYSAGDEYIDSITWLVPSFAPFGHYDVQVTVHGEDKDADIFACLRAQFDIQQWQLSNYEIIWILAVPSSIDWHSTEEEI